MQGFSLSIPFSKIHVLPMYKSISEKGFIIILSAAGRSVPTTHGKQAFVSKKITHTHVSTYPNPSSY
jgi:hypothetical protein